MSGESDFAAAIRDAFDRPGANAQVEAIKTVVSRRFEEADRGVRIKHTAYFNHTVAPDLILEWPRSGRTRHLFLRANSNPAWLADDLPWISKAKPIVFALTPEDASSAEPAETGTLRDAATAAETLVTDPDAVDQIEVRRASAPVVGLLTQALLQGGRGVLAQPDASAVADATASGFDAAQRREASPTAAAAELLSSLLDAPLAGRMTRMLQAVWQGHGGSLTEFPNTISLGGALTDEDLLFLLDTIDTADWDFWRRIAAGVTVGQLARLALPENSPNFQRLVKAGLTHFTAKALRVRQDLGTDDGADPIWRTAHGCLALRGDGWTAYLAPSKADELPSSDEAGDGIAIGELRQRAAATQVGVGNVHLIRGDRSITYESVEFADVVNDPELAQLAEDRAGGRITRATITLPEGRRLTCDFTTASGTGHTTAIFPVADLVRVGVPLLIRLRDPEAAALAELVTPAPGLGDQFELPLDVE